MPGNPLRENSLFFYIEKNKKTNTTSVDQMWWCLPIIPALVGLRLEECQLRDSLGYMGKGEEEGK